MKTATKGAIGLPLAVQVVGRRFDEETVLRVMKEVEGLVKYDKWQVLYQWAFFALFIY